VDQAQRNSRIVYPKLSATLTEDELRALFAIKSDEWAWARTVARRGPSMVALLTHLKVFQHVGRFLPVRDLPPAAIAHVAKQTYLDASAEFGYDRRTSTISTRCSRSMRPPRNPRSPLCAGVPSIGVGATLST
jgi:hypothetical protein